MGDPYQSDRGPKKQAQKPKPQGRQWKDMKPEERTAWCRYFKGQGPRPT